MQKNWVEFYAKNEAPTEPSSFARFVMDRGLPGSTLVDLGSGNGRDTRLLATRYKACGIDPNSQNIESVKSSWQDAKLLIANADIVYSRFLLHAIPFDEVMEIIRLTSGYFVAEARAVGDQPRIYPEHERHYVDGQKLLTFLLDSGFIVQFYEVGQGLAPYRNEDPMLIRIIAKKHE